MKRFALTICLAASLVFLFGAVAMAANTLVIESKNAAMGSTVNVGLAISNDGPIKNIVIPLEIKEINAGSFQTAMSLSRTGGRLTLPMLGGINVMNIYANPDGVKCKAGPGGFKTISAVDGASPDGALFSIGKLFPVDPNLPAGSDPASGSLQLTITVTNTPGQFEIDTSCVDPANHLVFVADPTASILPAFTKGVITIITNACPTVTAPTPVSATVGTQASNQGTALDGEGDPINFWGADKGAISASGLWTYTPICADVPGFDVTINASDKGPTGCLGSTFTFHVNVAPTPLVVSGCGDVSVHWGATATKVIGVTGGCQPYAFSVPVGQGNVDQNGNWSFESTCQDLGSNAISVTITDDAGQTANCNFNLAVTNTAPTCNAPSPNPVVTTSATFVLGADANGDPLTVVIGTGTGWPGELLSGNSYYTGVRDDNAEPVITYTVSDGCETVQCSFKILYEQPWNICVVDVDEDTNAILPAGYAHTLGGMNKLVGLYATGGSAAGVGGFEFLVCYDQSILRFVSASRGPDLHATWEYFTYRTGQFGGNCGGACPNGYVKLIGITNMNNGVTPHVDAFKLEGVFALLTFFVDGNLNYIGLCPHIGFCSFECADNSISSKLGTTLFVPTGVGISFGVDYTCEGNNKPGYDVFPFIDFCVGAICIDRPPDDRGDINLNGVANEIGDAVLFSRFFMEGINVFPPIWRAVQVLATDINNDGMPLTVADLVYLIRIITGDAQPFPPQGSGFKLSPYANAVDVNSEVVGGTLNIRTNSTVDLGGALFVYRYSGLTVGEPALAAGTNLQIKSRASNGELRILVYGNASGARVQSGLNNLLTVPVSGNGTIELAESQVADANGALLTVNAAAKATPSTYALLQNYPNPFNAGTVIQFSLKDQGDWNLSIYNIAGQVVRTFEGSGQGSVSVAWNGTAQSGSPVASGMYFYRLSTQDFTATKKMVLMK